MSSPISGSGGNALNSWHTVSSPATRPTAAVTGAGQSFAQIAAGLGIGPQPNNAGVSGDPTGTTGTNPFGAGGPEGTGTVGGTGGSTGMVSGTGGTDQGGLAGGSGGTGSVGGVQSGTGATTGTQGGSAQSAGAAAVTGGTAGMGATTGATRSTGSAGSTGTIADLSGTDTFLKLLVAQLKNQDPTSPMDDQAFVTELAQFNTVEQMLNLKQAIDTQTTAQQASEGIGLLGRTVSYAAAGVSSNQTVTNQGTVTGVSLAGGKVELQVGSQQVDLSAVTAVSG